MNCGVKIIKLLGDDTRLLSESGIAGTQTKHSGDRDVWTIHLPPSQWNQRTSLSDTRDSRVSLVIPKPRSLLHEWWNWLVRVTSLSSWRQLSARPSGSIITRCETLMLSLSFYYQFQCLYIFLVMCKALYFEHVLIGNGALENAHVIIILNAILEWIQLVG